MNDDKSDKTNSHINISDHNEDKCPFSKIIEDIFKVHNKSEKPGIYLENSERAKVFLNSIINVTAMNANEDKSHNDDLINNIIASINRIKNNITTNLNNTDDSHLNEAIILLDRNNKNGNDSQMVEIELETNETEIIISERIKNKEDILSIINNDRIINDNNTLGTNKNDTDKYSSYIEILTIEPNNTSPYNTTSHNIFEVLKHLMPMFNSTLTKELHNITIIERSPQRNNSLLATKNISTIVVTYCDKDNLTRADTTHNYEKETEIKDPQMARIDFNDYLEEDRLDKKDEDDNDYEESTDASLTSDEKKDILEAAEYGMQKMHELYSIMEPKLYSMGNFFMFLL